jgi:hypothetical protein
MAIDVLSGVLSRLGLCAEDRETEGKTELIDARFLCKSCDSPIVMGFQRLIEHFHRHTETTVEVVSKADEAVALGSKYPYEAGSFAKYTARTKEAKEMRKMKVFGCRHCQHRSPEPTIARPARKSGHLWQKRFTFDGLISHTKEKHKIFPLADEDFFRDDPIESIDAKGEDTQPEIFNW